MSISEKQIELEYRIMYWALLFMIVIVPISCIGLCAWGLWIVTQVVLQ